MRSAYSASLAPGMAKTSHVIGEDVEIGAGSAAAEAECGAASVHDLGHDGAGGSAHRRGSLVFDLLRGLGEDEGLAGVYEEQDDVRRQRGCGERGVDDVLASAMGERESRRGPPA